MLIGLIRMDGSLMKTKDVLNEAYETGSVDGYPFMVLAKILDAWTSKNPSASAIATVTWRRSVLENILDYYAYPGDMIPLVRGSLIHNGLEAVKAPYGIKLIREKYLKYNLPGYDEIRTLSGKIDLYVPKMGRLVDYKTCMKVPALVKPAHVCQLAVYTWLLRWNNYPVKEAGIDYISWRDMAYIMEAKMPNEDTAPLIEHPLLESEKKFLQHVEEGWEILDEGYRNYIIPSMQYCNTSWCRGCRVKWACDYIRTRGEQIDPSEFNQEDFM